MPRYFSEQTLLDLSKDMNYVYDLTDLEEFLTDVPTADVVPKRDYDILKSLITHKEEEAYNKGYEDGKQDIAREIFEEIEKYFYNNEHKTGVLIYCDFFNFKKEYTKSEQKSCENCTYYDDCREDQPCYSCNDCSNWERGKRKMKQENRERIIRALGILKDIWFSASPKTQDGIVSATEMLEDALDNEGKE